MEQGFVEFLHCKADISLHHCIVIALIEEKIKTKLICGAYNEK
jgi:hypothetical protein